MITGLVITFEHTIQNPCSFKKVRRIIILWKIVKVTKLNTLQKKREKVLSNLKTLKKMLIWRSEMSWHAQTGILAACRI